jgi:alpha-glucoside transport system substrate-binding protein
MDRRRGRLRWLGPLLALSLVAAACNGEDVPLDPEPGIDNGTENGEAAALPDLSGERLEVAGVWQQGTGELQRIEEILDEFAEQTGANVTFTSTGDDIATVLGPRVEGGDPPDVAFLPQPGLMQDFADQGALIDIEEAAGATVDQNFAQTWRDLGTVDGTLYGVWFKATNKSTFWYNLNVFDDAGVTPPEDWDAFVETAQTLTDFGVAAHAVDGASGWVLSDWFENIYLRTAGPDLYDQLANHEIEWTDESVVTALERMGQVMQGNLLAGGIDGTLQSEFPNSVTRTFADPPDAGMVYEGDFVAGIIDSETDAVVGEDADFFDFPAIDGSPTSVVVSGDVAVLMRDSEGGRALIEWLARPEPAEMWASQGGFTSPNQNLDVGIYPDDITRRSAEALVEAGDAAKFDMSDLQPAEFGSTSGQGIWGLLQEFVRQGDAQRTAQQLEQAASRAFGNS